MPLPEKESVEHTTAAVEDGELHAIALRAHVQISSPPTCPRVVRRAHALADERFHAHRLHAVMHVDPDADERGGVGGTAESPADRIA